MTNNSGIHPVGDRILVKPDVINEESDGGIFIPKQVRDQHGQAQVAGVLVAHGPDAWTDYQGPFAKPGYRVMFAKYHGINVVGKDGVQYRVLNDRDVTAVIEEGVEFNDIQARTPLD